MGIVHGVDVERQVGEDEVEAAGGVVRVGAMSNDEFRVSNLEKSESRIAKVEGISHFRLSRFSWMQP